jgi:UPF0755 protein
LLQEDSADRWSACLNSNPPPNGNGRPYNNGPVPVPPPPAANKLPRSPRAALEPERVPPPSRRSKRVRHPLVVMGNAIFMFLVIITVGIGGALFVGKQRFEAPGPLAEDKIVNIPRGFGVKDIADMLVREGVIDQPWVFIGGVVVLKSRGDIKFGEYQFPKSASLADVVEIMIENKVVQHAFTVAADLRADRGAASGKPIAVRSDQGNSA